MKDSTNDKLQLASVFFVSGVLVFVCYVFLVRYQCLPKPEWFRAIEGPNQPQFSKP